MNNFFNIFFFKSNKFISIVIFFYSFLINYYYSNFGVFPIDTFFHYDAAVRILKNEFPVKDFWIVSGFIIDFIQSFFFKIFGISWNSYLIHSSILNFIISIIIYYFFLDLKINKIKSFILTLSFATLAYTISGTPFVDHHATFFLLISTILLIKVIRTEKNYIWFVVTLLFLLSFLTKQVPAGYFLIIQGFIISFYIFYKKKYHFIKYIAVSFLIFIFIFISIAMYLEIGLFNFYIQYIAYPQSIGTSRIENFDISLNDFFNNYKFLLIPLFLIIFLKIKTATRKNFFLEKKTFEFLILLSFIFCTLFHQIMTKNQIFIYFLIPILFGILDSELKLFNHKHQKYFSFIIIVSLLFITTKYHYRYNESRKFHELEKVNFKNALPAYKIDRSLNGLLWINPSFKNETIEEMTKIKKGITILNEEKEELMLITHYLFLDSITNKNLNYPNRAFTVDGTSMPSKKNEYFNFYKSFLLGKIKNKKIKKILYFKHEKIPQKTITDYLDLSCFEKHEDDIFFIYIIKCIN